MIKAIATFDEKFLRGGLRKSKRLLSKYGNRLKRRILYRIIDLSNMVLMDIYRLPWSAAQSIAHGIARCIGDVSSLLLQFPRLPAYKLTGAKWKIIFVGTRKTSLLQICHLFFEGNFHQEKIGEIAFWKLPVESQKWLAEGVDLVVCELGRLCPNRPKAAFTFNVPVWINQVITIPEQLERLISGKKLNTVRERLNRAGRYGFSYRFSQSLSDFDNFHYNMYLPFVKGRHGDLALLADYETQRRWFAKGGVLLITQHGKPVAGGLCCIRDGQYFSIEGGVLQADPELIQAGIQTIMTWYKITWAREQGAKLYNMGGTYGWCSNPSFIAKRRWRARVVRRKKIYETWTFLTTNLSIPLQNHINKLGFISEIDGKFYRTMLSNDDDSIAETIISRELLATKKEGLDGLVVVSADSEPLLKRITRFTGNGD